MPEKIAPSPRKPRKSPNAALPKKTDPIADKLLQHLANTPALTAAGVLAGMLPDTEDPATRLAIMRTRIQVLRARTTACQLGQPVAGNITLGEVFANQARADQQLSAQVATPSDPEPEAIADAGRDPELADNPVQVRLLETYTHEGIELRKGGVFLVSANSAKDLAERGICEVLAEPETPDIGTTAADTGTADTDTPEDPENVK
ncbi:hypothetical protein [Lacimonas salitolerans]|uniref:Uncharacterized protein n=1 Tax=Lacimonas salitolerans TaxID=1323750 RepID=A0ABW4EJD8_9RHOB